MTFTKTPPAKPGFFAWRDAIPGYQDEPCAVEIYDSAGRLFADKEGKIWSDKLWPAWGGEWCRLVPAEEIEEAWDESLSVTGLKGADPKLMWESSRAKKVREGKI